MQGFKNLSAVVSYVPSKSGRYGKWATIAQVKIGPILVASANLNGKWGQLDVLKELQKNPKRFQQEWGWNVAKTMRLIAA